jgi:SOS response regulatory protein OraA/RecX
VARNLLPSHPNSLSSLCFSSLVAGFRPSHLYFVASLLRCFYSSSVFSSRRSLETESELYDVALRALMRRSHSILEMKRLLARRTKNDLLVQVVMARLRENGQLDDAHYAKQFARQRAQVRKQGKFRIARDLRARGVSDPNIQSALEDSADDSAERAALRQRIDRKLKLVRLRHTDDPLADKIANDRKMASLYRSLLAAGFPADAIRRELRSFATEFSDTDADGQLDSHSEQ